MDGARAAAVTVAALAAAAVLVPAACAARGARAGLAAGGALAAASAAAAALLAGAGPGLLSGVPVLGFAVLAAGLSRGLLAARVPPAVAAGVASVLGCCLLALPFLGDPLVEARGPGRASPAAISALLGGCPVAAAAGGALGVDLLRARRAYGGAEGPGLSRIGAYYPYAYPGPLAQGAATGAAGAALLLLARRRRDP